MSIPSHLTLEIVTPDRAVVHEEVDEVELPGTDGYLGVLPGHAPLLTSLQVGQLWYRKDQDRFYALVAFGFAEVLPDRVTILAHVAERPEEIDSSRAEAARMRAENLLVKPTADVDWKRAQIALLKSQIRLQIASKHRVR